MMGGKSTKPSKRIEAQVSKCDSEVNVDGSDSAIMGRYHEEIIKTIRRDLNEDPEMFVLNNVLMCTMFQENYYKDVNEAMNLTKDANKDAFTEPDKFLEKINNNVTYRPLHGEKKNTAQPLVTKRVYVPMDEFIEVYNPMDATQAPTTTPNGKFHVMIEKSKKKGYLKLRVTDSTSSADSQSNKDCLAVPSSSNSGSSDTESSDHTSTDDAEFCPQLIKDQSEEYSLKDCLVYRKVKKEDIDVMLEEMDHDNIIDEDVYDIVGYLNSKTFMKFFQTKVFKSSIARTVGLIPHETDHAYVLQHAPGKVYCNLLDNDGNKCPVEVIPYLKISWPQHDTFEFLNRDPDEMNTWLKDKDLDLMKHFQCALVPKGYSKISGEPPEGDIYWEIHFPAAESYLECALRPEQIKCYMVFLALFKEYIEPLTKKRGVLPEHFRTLIFHEAERNYNGWPEHRLGVKFMNVCKNFTLAIRNRILRDYFVRPKNLFKNRSRRHQQVANEVFHKLLQSPLMMIIRALRNIRYTRGRFYPPLDYKELLEILYKKNWDEPERQYVKEDQMSMVSGVSGQKKPKFADAEKQLMYAKHQRVKNTIVEGIKQKEPPKKTLSYTVSKVRRTSTDSIKDEWECEKSFHRLKKRALLEFFIKNYMEIATVSSRIGTKRQTLFYLKQAGYLARIVQQEDPLFKDDVNDLLKQIAAKEGECIRTITMNMEDHGYSEDKIVIAPKQETHRSSAAELNLHQQVRKKQINLRSLNSSYLRTFSYNGEEDDGHLQGHS